MLYSWKKTFVLFLANARQLDKGRFYFNLMLDSLKKQVFHFSGCQTVWKTMLLFSANAGQLEPVHILQH